MGKKQDKFSTQALPPSRNRMRSFLAAHEDDSSISSGSGRWAEAPSRNSSSSFTGSRASSNSGKFATTSRASTTSESRNANPSIKSNISHHDISSISSDESNGSRYVKKQSGMNSRLTGALKAELFFKTKRTPAIGGRLPGQENTAIYNMSLIAEETEKKYLPRERERTARAAYHKPESDGHSVPSSIYILRGYNHDSRYKSQSARNTHSHSLTTDSGTRSTGKGR